MARNPYIVDDDAELRKAALIESGVDPELLEEAPTPEAPPVMPVAPEAPAYSSKSDRVREAIYAAGTRQKLSPEFFQRPAKEAEAAAQREILKQRVMAQWSKRQAEAAALKRKSSPDSEESKIAVALWESSPEGSRIMENMRANHPELAAKVAAAHIPEWKVALPHEQRTAAPAQKAAAAVEAAPALEGAKGNEARKTLDDKQAGDLELQAQRDAAALERARIMAAGRKEALSAKQGEKDLLTEIPGYEKTGEVMVKAEVAEKMRGRVAGRDRIIAGTDKLKKLIDADPLKFRSGAWMVDPKMRAEVITAFNSIKMGVKQNEDLGALVGGDFKLIEEAAVDPRNPMEVLKTLIGQSAFRDQLNSYPSTVSELTENELRLRGYRQKGATPSKTSGKDAKPASMEVNGATYDLDPSTGKYKKRAK